MILLSMRFNPLARHINILNILLLAGVIGCAFYLLPPLLGTKVTLTMPSAKKSVEEKEEKAVEAKSLSPLEYSIIAEQNLFHAERKIPEKVETAALPKPEFVLYGTMITDGLSIAYMEDLKAPASTPGRGKRQRALRAGSLLSGYTLSEVYHDRVIMARGEDRMTIKVAGRDKKASVPETAAPAQRPATKTIPPEVLREKPQGAGLPPGVVKKEPPPPGAPVPDEKAMMKVKEQFDAIIREKLGKQPEVKK
jgi:hypothetical protein